jgi:DNA-binding ferritin-like protein
MYTSGQPPVQYVPAPQVEPKVVEPKAKKTKVVVAKLDIPTFIQQLIGHASYANQLYTQAHLNHLNYEASNFFSIHEFLKEQYEAHIEQFDKLAEFTRSMDYLMPMCACGLRDAHPDFDNVTSYDGRSMLMTYLKNLEDFAMKSKDLAMVAREIEAIDIENYAAELAGETFKATWFLKATLRHN